MRIPRSSKALPGRRRRFEATPQRRAPRNGRRRGGGHGSEQRNRPRARRPGDARSPRPPRPPPGRLLRNGRAGLRVLFACHRLGLSVPEQVAVTGFDGTEHSAYSLPPLTTVRQPIHDIARRALDMVRGADAAGSRHETVEFELVVRESCGEHAER
ncbi:substrate-binding domain-containing protein [Labedella populi]|uniref:substrate-binding domain-containing protein n=1 Tax=Labedella populi TaxID=2498850 RepID=UPI00140B50B2|nr:substrate-binding domain-containing protein [Labedella populi]